MHGACLLERYPAFSQENLPDTLFSNLRFLFRFPGRWLRKDGSFLKWKRSYLDAWKDMRWFHDKMIVLAWDMDEW